MRTVTFVLAFTISSSGVENDRAMQLLHQWTVAVEQHQAGERDAALTSVSTWTYDELELMRAYVQLLVELPLTNNERRARSAKVPRADLAAIRGLAKNLRARDDVGNFRKRAAIFHTDAALLASAPRILTAPVVAPAVRPGDASPEVHVLSFDGRVERYQAGNPHWQYAMDLLESVPIVSDRDTIAAEWYRAVGAYFARERKFADALTHFGRAHQIVTGDAGVLYGEACLQETLGAPPVQNYVRVTTLPNGLVLQGVYSPQVHHRKAEQLLRQALAAKPDFIEAHLRLGRVLAELKNYDEAVTHFQRVIDSASDPVLTYYAHLFTGDARMAMGRAADAKSAYEGATGLYPTSQAAHLGLGAALRMLGQRQAALDAVMSTLALAPDARDAADEPWWNYYEGDAANVDRLFDELRRPFREPVK